VSQRFEDLDADAQDTQPARAPRNVFQVVWQRKSLVALGAVIGLVLGSLLYAQRAPVYQSAAQILVVKKRSGEVMQFAGGSGDPRVSYVEDYLATHLVLIKSPLIVERAVKKRDLQSLKSFDGMGDPTGAILGTLIVARDKESGTGPSNILNLSFRGPGAEDCAKVLSAVIESYQEFLDVTYRNVSDQTLDLITKARDLLNKDLADSQKKYEEFRRNSPMLWKAKDGTNIYLERVTAIEGQRSKLLIHEAEARERLRAVDRGLAEGRPRDSLLAMLVAKEKKETPTAHRPLEDQLLALRLQEEQLLEDYGPDHPLIQSVRHRLAVVRELVKTGLIQADGVPAAGTPAPEKSSAVVDSLDRYLQALRLDLQETEMVQQSLAHLLEGMKAEARALSNYADEEDRLRGDILRIQQLHDGTIKRLAEINLVRDAGGFQAQTLARPSPGAKIAPSALQTLVGGLMLGILAGVGLAYLVDVSDKSFRNPDEVRRRLGLPLVGHIPFLTPDAEAVRKVEAGQPVPDPLLCTHYRPKSIDAESYRAVRTALYFSTQGEGHKVIQVTSPNKGDGKSLMIANLAVSIAQSGKRVILIDADCRRPRQHKIFGLSANAGLAAVIADRVEPKDVIQTTAVGGLSVLPCGPVPPNPAELLTSPRFKELLDAIREEYDFVLVDTPPLLAVTDPCVVAPRVDGIFLVIRLSRQGRPNAERARTILAGLGVNVLGVVVNGMTRQAGAGIYTAEQYEYAYSENYEQDAYYAERNEEGYYGDQDDAPPAGSGSASPDDSPKTETVLEPQQQAITVSDKPAHVPRTVRASGGRGGLLSWLMTWWV
jgi:polysaccharide biosynthesis transport protein